MANVDATLPLDAPREREAVPDGGGSVFPETVKVQAGLMAPVPLAFRALTRQEYWPVASDAVVHEVPETQGLTIAPSLIVT